MKILMKEKGVAVVDDVFEGSVSYESDPREKVRLRCGTLPFSGLIVYTLKDKDGLRAGSTLTLTGDIKQHWIAGFHEGDTSKRYWFLPSKLTTKKPSIQRVQADVEHTLGMEVEFTDKNQYVVNEVKEDSPFFTLIPEGSEILQFNSKDPDLKLFAETRGEITIVFISSSQVEVEDNFDFEVLPSDGNHFDAEEFLQEEKSSYNARFHVFWINLEESIDRKAHMLEQFEKSSCPFENTRFEAQRPNLDATFHEREREFLTPGGISDRVSQFHLESRRRGVIGANLSMRKMLKSIIDSDPKYDYVISLEDDVDFHGSWIWNYVIRFISEYPYEWDIIRFNTFSEVTQECHLNENMIWKLDNGIVCESIYGWGWNGFVILKVSSLPMILKYLLESPLDAIDFQLGNSFAMKPYGLTTLVCQKKLAWDEQNLRSMIPKGSSSNKKSYAKVKLDELYPLNRPKSIIPKPRIREIETECKQSSDCGDVTSNFHKDCKIIECINNRCLTVQQPMGVRCKMESNAKSYAYASCDGHGQCVGVKKDISDATLMWWRDPDSDIMNFGDELNQFIFTWFTGVVHPKRNEKDPFYADYYVIGSIIHQASTEFSKQKKLGSPPKKGLVWGTGMLSNVTEISCDLTFLAVRGPLTRQVLLENGCDVPEIYGDPGLLMPFYYQPPFRLWQRKLDEYCIIPHKWDYDRFEKTLDHFNFPHTGRTEPYDKLKIIFEDQTLTWIDIRTDNTKQFVDNLIQCKHVFSASLHGLILAEAYGIPWKWYSFFETGSWNRKNFKYHDFFKSIGTTDYRFRMTPHTRLKQIQDVEFQVAEKRSKESMVDLEKLLHACPFCDASVVARILES